MIPSAFTYSSAGLSQSYQGLNRSAQEVASAGVAQQQVRPDPSTAPANKVNPLPAGEGMNAALVGMKQQLHLFNASAKVFSTADQQIGTLLDTTA